MRSTPADLRVRREALGLTQGWLAEQVGVQDRAVRRWEAGDRATIPDDVWTLLDEGENRADILVHSLLVSRRREAEATAIGTGRAGESVEVTAYATDADLWAAHPDLAPWPASWHRATLGRLRIELTPIPVTFTYGPRAG